MSRSESQYVLVRLYCSTSEVGGCQIILVVAEQGVDLILCVGVKESLRNSRDDHMALVTPAQHGSATLRSIRVTWNVLPQIRRMCNLSAPINDDDLDV